MRVAHAQPPRVRAVDAPRAVRRAMWGWGRRPVETCEVYEPAHLDQVAEIAACAPHSLLARGLGRSYGDSALNRDAGLILTARLDRVLGFDAEAGTLRCEAGLSLAGILELAVAHGFFFPVTPGTKHISVGGAIAADVHGKNHHAGGSMSAFVNELRLLTASGEVVSCSPRSRPELFWATVGGMGLTGVVLEAELRLRRVESAWMEVEHRRLPDLDALLACLEAGDRDWDYAVAWVDTLSRGRRLGRSVVMRANHAAPDALPPDRRSRPYQRAWHPSVRVPFLLPSGLLGRPALHAFNAVYYRAHRTRRFLADCDRYFYPLDAVRDWNRAYGRRGAFQYQVLLPTGATRDGMRDLLEELSGSMRASWIGVVKACGPASEGLLSFPGPGCSLAVDLPVRPSEGVEALARLDRITLRHGGRVYLAKESWLDPVAFAEMYPSARRFRSVKGDVDPEGRFSSSQARRLGLTAG